MNVAVGPGDHVIVTWPGYQSLYEVARATGADITLHGLHESDGWAVDLDRLKSEVRPTTKLIVVNTPHSPTGMMLDRTTYDGIIEIAEEGGIWLFMDEVYRGLEYDESDRLAAGADALANGISLGVMSKAYAMAGLRIGWIATHDRDLLTRLAAFKDYTTICSSGPSEILAIIALRARDRILERSRGIIASNLELVDGFFEDYLDRFTWIRPSAGSVGFPRLTVPGVAIDDWAAELVKAEGVLILPGSVFGYAGNHFRLGLGRTDLPDALARLEKFASRTLR
jgi:aspartate/methionine/tyrosine aminotransferase